MARFLRLTAILASAAALLGLPGSGSAADPRSVLGLDLRGATKSAIAGMPARLVHVDPLTLRVRPGRAVELQGHVGARSWSPDRTRLAFARNRVPSLRIVDAIAMRPLGDVALGRSGDVRAVAWPARSRLLAVVDGSLIGVDAARLRVVERTPLRGTVLADAETAGRLALLVAPERGIGPARLVVADGVTTRELLLERIDAGRGASRLVVPGLALEPSGSRAWVVGAAAAAEIDLETLAVGYRDAPRSPASLRKGRFGGSARTAVWIAPGRIAVAGEDRPDAARPATPTGLLLIDTETWNARQMTEESPLLYVHSDLLLTVAGDCAGRPGLTAYEPDGAPRFHVCEPRARGDVSFAAGRAYLGLDGERVAVVDLRTGAVVARPRSTGAGPLGE
jgi:hypothetical protein